MKKLFNLFKRKKIRIRNNNYDKNNICILLDYFDIVEIFTKYKNKDIYEIFSEIDNDIEEFNSIINNFYAIFLLSIDKNIINDFINYINICGFTYSIKENEHSYLILLKGTIENFNNSLKTKYIRLIEESYHYIIKIILKCIYKLPFIYFKGNKDAYTTDFETFRNTMLIPNNHKKVEIEGKIYYIINNTLIERMNLNIKNIFKQSDILNTLAFIEQNTTKVIPFLEVLFNEDKYKELKKYIYDKYYMMQSYQLEEESIEIINEDVTEFEEIFNSVCDVNIYEETDYNKD